MFVRDLLKRPFEPRGTIRLVQLVQYCHASEMLSAYCWFGEEMGMVHKKVIIVYAANSLLLFLF